VSLSSLFEIPYIALFLLLGETQRHLEDLRKKMQELNRGFDLERKRFETQKTVDTNTIKRVHLEKEVAQKELGVVEGKLTEKRQQLVDAFEEIEKLEAELQEVC
jgi:chromosome segregation ATPase